MTNRKEPDHLDANLPTTLPISIFAQMKHNVFPLLSIGFGVTALAMILGSTYSPSGMFIGENLVQIEVQVLPGFYMKPITFFTFTLFLSFAFGLYSPQTRQRFLSARPSILRTLFIGSWLVAMGSAFEIMYQVVLWSAALTVQGAVNPDVIVNQYPVSANPTPINIVFASKIIVAIFFMSIFLIDYVHRIDRIKQEKAFTDRLISYR